MRVSKKKVMASLMNNQVITCEHTEGEFVVNLTYTEVISTIGMGTEEVAKKGIRVRDAFEKEINELLKDKKGYDSKIDSKVFVKGYTHQDAAKFDNNGEIGDLIFRLDANIYAVKGSTDAKADLALEMKELIEDKYYKG